MENSYSDSRWNLEKGFSTPRIGQHQNPNAQARALSIAKHKTVALTYKSLVMCIRNASGNHNPHPKTICSAVFRRETLCGDKIVTARTFDRSRPRRRQTERCAKRRCLFPLLQSRLRCQTTPSEVASRRQRHPGSSRAGVRITSMLSSVFGQHKLKMNDAHYAQRLFPLCCHWIRGQLRGRSLAPSH